MADEPLGAACSRYAPHEPHGGRIVCTDMRRECASMRPDGAPLDYDMVADAFRP